jgi:hypothetical protein
VRNGAVTAKRTAPHAHDPMSGVSSEGIPGA